MILILYPYLLGKDFSAADIMVGSTLAWGSMMGILDSSPTLAKYTERLQARPATQRTFAD